MTMIKDPDGCDLSLSDRHLHLDGPAVSLRAPYIHAVFPFDIVVKRYLLNGRNRALFLRGRFIFHRFSCEGIPDRAENSSGTVGGTGYHIHLPGLCLKDSADHAFCLCQKLCRLPGSAQNGYIRDLVLFHGHLHSYFAPVTAGGSGVDTVFIGIAGILDLLLCLLLRIGQSRLLLCGVYLGQNEPFRKCFQHRNGPG